MKLKRVCVFCGSSSGSKDEYTEAAINLGKVFVSRKIGLVYGGSNLGLMKNIADTVYKNGGEVIGVMPQQLADQEIAHKKITKLKIVDSMQERKVLMDKLSDAFIAMPGGFGTLDEIFEMIVSAQLELHHKPCGFLNIKGFYNKLLEFVDHTISEGFIKKEYRKILQIDNTPEELVNKLENYLPEKVDKIKWARNRP